MTRYGTFGSNPAEVEDTDEVRALHARGEPGLAEEARAEDVVRRVLRLHELDRDFLLELGIPA